MNATLIRTRPIIKVGDSLYIDSSLEGQVVKGPSFYSKLDIVRFLGDDATLITHRYWDGEANNYLDITEELAAIWVDLHSDVTPYEENLVPQYVLRSNEWKNVCSEYPKTPMRVALSLHVNSAGRSL